MALGEKCALVVFGGAPRIGWERASGAPPAKMAIAAQVPGAGMGAASLEQAAKAAGDRAVKRLAEEPKKPRRKNA